MYELTLHRCLMPHYACSIFYDLMRAFSTVHQIRHCRSGSYRLLERDAAAASVSTVFSRKPCVGFTRVSVRLSTVALRFMEFRHPHRQYSSSLTPGQDPCILGNSDFSTSIPKRATGRGDAPSRLQGHSHLASFVNSAFWTADDS